MPDPCSNNPSSISHLNQAYQDKFVLSMKLPLILLKESQKNPYFKNEYLQMGVYGTIVPSSSIPAVEQRFAGQSVHFSSHSRPAYNPLVLSFVIDNLYNNYFLLWQWLNVLNTERESIYAGTPQRLQKKSELLEYGTATEYQTNLSIISVDEFNKPIIEFIYYNAFITNLGGINYSYRNQDPLETTVEFYFGQLEMRRVKS